MTKEDAIKRAGSPSELARLLGCSRQAVNNWVKLPQGRLWQLMVLRPEWFEVIEWGGHCLSLLSCWRSMVRLLGFFLWWSQWSYTELIY